ncbi:MAG: sulfite exporter TauE/SafE family protein [Gammaproteobacteria bacterium]|nr:sulfite exporter TauE/SafE family protein [Gammaproteobacteria bacterium]
MTELFISAIAIGFFGSLHCIGMCGGLVSALCMTRPKLWWPGLLSYQLGRVFTYTVLGFIAGFLGSSLGDIAWFKQAQWLLTLLAGGLMILFACYLGGWLPDPFSRLTAKISQATGMTFWIKKASSSNRLDAWLIVGMLNGLLPCGLVYAGLALSLTVSSPYYGAITMFLFGLGTVPAMLVTPTLLRKITPVKRGHFLKIAALLLIALGLLTMLRGNLHHHDHSATSQLNDHSTHTQHH